MMLQHSCEGPALRLHRRRDSTPRVGFIMTTVSVKSCISALATGDYEWAAQRRTSKPQRLSGAA